MPAFNYSATVSDIQLTAFTYNTDYDFSQLDEVKLDVTVLNRFSGDALLEVMVKLDYIDKKTLEPVLNTSCVTTYNLLGLDEHVKPDDTGEVSIRIPNDLDRIMGIEAIAHARALVGLQAASTPLGKTYVSLGMGVLRKLMIDTFKELTKDNA